MVVPTYLGTMALGGVAGIPINSPYNSLLMSNMSAMGLQMTNNMPAEHTRWESQGCLNKYLSHLNQANLYNHFPAPLLGPNMPQSQLTLVQFLQFDSGWGQKNLLVWASEFTFIQFQFLQFDWGGGHINLLVWACELISLIWRVGKEGDGGLNPHRGRNHVVTRGENCVEWFAAADWRGGGSRHHHHHRQDHDHHGHGQHHHYIMTKQDVRIASSDLQQTGRKGEWGREIGGVIYRNQKQINSWQEIIFKIWWYTWCRWKSGDGLRMPFCIKKITRCSLKLNRFSTELPFSKENLELRFHQSIFHGWKM